MKHKHSRDCWDRQTWCLDMHGYASYVRKFARINRATRSYTELWSDDIWRLRSLRSLLVQDRELTVKSVNLLRILCNNLLQFRLEHKSWRQLVKWQFQEGLPWVSDGFRPFQASNLFGSFFGSFSDLRILLQQQFFFGRTIESKNPCRLCFSL